MNRLWIFIQLLIQRKHSEAFEHIKLFKEKSKWSTNELADLVDRLVELSKERFLDLVNLAYSSISVLELSNQLSISQDETIAICLSKSWSLDSTNQFIIPAKKVQIETNTIPNQLQMQQLTSLVSFLET